MNKDYIYKRRLLALADLLDTLPKEKFNYAHWVDSETWKGKVNLSCGTTACAFGWATTMPALRKLGLYLSASDGVCLKNDRGNYLANAAARIVFGLSYDEFKYLFYPRTYLIKNSDDLINISYPYYGMNLPVSPPATASAKDVAKHIRKFVKEKTDAYISS